MATSRSDAFVFFGATGDLAKKQTWPALLALTKAGRLDMPIVAVGRHDVGVDAIRAEAKKSLEDTKSFDAAAFARMSERLSYVAVDYDDPKTFDAIKRAIGAAQRPLAYVALPPQLFEKVAANLAKANLAKGGRLVVEKPFGHDLASARALSAKLHAAFPEDSLFRIDHYLGKEQVENIVFFRAANRLFEATWSHEHIASVEITMAESFGIEDRAGFYDSVGTVRDVVQNHLLEVMAYLAMELPAARGHTALRDARTKLLTHVKALGPDDLVRGQVRGYRDVRGVAKDSTTETFASLRFTVDSARWRGVPFYVRTGKALAETMTEAIVRWKSVGHPVLEDTAAPRANALRFRIGPNNFIALATNVKAPGEAMRGESSELSLCRPATGMKAYERLLGDAIDGDASMFARQDTVEEAWRIVDGALAAKTPVYPYDKGSWGPEEAARLAPKGGWSNAG